MAKYFSRYGAMRFLGIFSYPDGRQLLSHGTRVIVRTARGQETGTVLCEATATVVARFPGDYEEGRVLRPMSRDDETEARRIHNEEKNEFQRCRAVVERMKIDMSLVRIEHLFGGERIIVYYVADGRVDFRELVKVLASEFQTRIEMRQIGVRDETKLLADFGDCGREVCCNSYLVEMPPVSMKMAKLQKATLDPTKISGRCGRLKCCLRYEYDVYTAIQREMPGIGKAVSTPDGNGHVVAHEILRHLVTVDLPDHGRKQYEPGDVRLLASHDWGAEDDRADFPDLELAE